MLKDLRASDSGEYLCNVSSTEYTLLTVHRLHVGKLQIGHTNGFWVSQQRLVKTFHDVIDGDTFAHGGRWHAIFWSKLLLEDRLFFFLCFEMKENVHFGGSSTFNSSSLLCVLYTFMPWLGVEAVGIGDIRIGNFRMLGNTWMSVNLVETVTWYLKHEESAWFSSLFTAVSCQNSLFIRTTPSPLTRLGICDVKLAFWMRWLASPPFFYHPGIEETLTALFHPLIRIFEIVKIITCFINF